MPEKQDLTSIREEIIQRVLRVLISKNSEKKVAILSEAIEMIEQGKSLDEIKKHFGFV